MKNEIIFKCNVCGVVCDKVEFRGRMIKPASIKLRLFSEHTKFELDDCCFCKPCSGKIWHNMNELGYKKFFRMMAGK